MRAERQVDPLFPMDPRELRAEAKEALMNGQRREAAGMYDDLRAYFVGQSEYGKAIECAEIAGTTLFSLQDRDRRREDWLRAQEMFERGMWYRAYQIKQLHDLPTMPSDEFCETDQRWWELWKWRNTIQRRIPLT